MTALGLRQVQARAVSISPRFNRPDGVSIISNICQPVNVKGHRHVSSTSSKTTSCGTRIDRVSVKARNPLTSRMQLLPPGSIIRYFSGTTLRRASNTPRPSSSWSLGRLAFILVDLITRPIFRLVGISFGFLFRRLGLYSAASARYRWLYLTNYDQFTAEQRRRRTYIQALLCLPVLWMGWKIKNFVGRYSESSQLASNYERSQIERRQRLEELQAKIQALKPIQNSNDLTAGERKERDEIAQMVMRSISDAKDQQEKPVGVLPR